MKILTGSRRLCDPDLPNGELEHQMRITTYSANGETFYGAVTETGMVALSPDFPAWPTLYDAIAAGGFDTLIGGVGNDTIEGGLGDDYLNKISRDQFRATPWHALPLPDLQKLRFTATTRSRRKS